MCVTRIAKDGRYAYNHGAGTVSTRKRKPSRRQFWKMTLQKEKDMLFPSVKTGSNNKNWAKAHANHSRMVGFIIHHLSFIIL
jgi:hypothetical protein